VPALYVLDVPEFAPIIRALTAKSLRAVRAGGYVRLSSDRAIDLARSEVTMPDAVWFGFAVGGIEGRITRHDVDGFRLE
jgi:hypothetical protein